METRNIESLNQEQMMNINFIRWAGELSNQEGFKGPQEVIKEFKIMMGC